LNGLDITSLFNPIPEGTDAVTLNLNQGRNKLILSVDAHLTNRVANDKDTLLFMVPSKETGGGHQYRDDCSLL
jgi:hypothetical protein